MIRENHRHDTLHVYFFVGLFLAICVGMGIAVFYPAPVPPVEPAVMQSIGKEGPTASQQQEINVFNAKQRVYERQMQHYNRNVSTVALLGAVAILAIAVIFAEQLGSIADGLLLGGIFSLLYGIGRGMASDNNKYRFAIAATGLMVTLALGYSKFGRPAGSHNPTSPPMA